MGRIRRRIIATERSEFDHLAVRRAGPDDFEAVFEIVDEAAKWLASRGIPQWRFFLTDGGKTFVRNRIDSAETYLVLGNSRQTVGTFVIQWSDNEIWGARGLDCHAGYVHGLAIRRITAGTGLGLRLLDLASDLIAR